MFSFSDCEVKGSGIPMFEIVIAFSEFFCVFTSLVEVDICFAANLVVACLQSTFIGQSHKPVFGLKNKSSSHARTECVPPSHI
jgi:hypothetical protein